MLRSWLRGISCGGRPRALMQAAFGMLDRERCLVDSELMHRGSLTIGTIEWLFFEPCY